MSDRVMGGRWIENGLGDIAVGWSGRQLGYSEGILSGRERIVVERSLNLLAD